MFKYYVYLFVYTNIAFDWWYVIIDDSVSTKLKRLMKKDSLLRRASTS